VSHSLFELDFDTRRETEGASKAGGQTSLDK
jgi:hypothetical protein